MSGGRDITFYSQEGKEAFDKAIQEWLDEVWYRKQDKIVFTNLNGTVYSGEKVPDDMASLIIEDKIYWTEVKEIQALQDYLSLRVQQAERRDAKLALAIKGIKKVRNKMLHLKPKKKRR